MTAASRTLPLGAKAKLTNRDNGKSVNVTVTDRGPYAKTRITFQVRAPGMAMHNALATRDNDDGR